MVFARSVAAFAVVLVAFSSALASEKKYDVCYEKGQRCAGAKGHPYVKYAACCDKDYVCVEDKEMGWGRFCKKPSSEYWNKCYIKGARCEGAPGKPYVEYHKCCGKAECKEDEKMGWGKFCKVKKEEEKEYEKVYKKVYEDAKKKKEYDYEKKSYKGTFYETKDGKVKYESYKKDYKKDSKKDSKKKSYKKGDKKKGYDYYSYGSKYGKVVKGKGDIGKKTVETGICKLGGGSAATGCADTLPTARNVAIYYLTIRVDSCKGPFPCNAAISIRHLICQLFSFFTSRRCFFTGVLSDPFMGHVGRQGITPPVGNALGGATLVPTTTTNGTAATAAPAVTTTAGQTVLGCAVYFDCAEFTPAREALIDAAAGRATTFAKDTSRCVVTGATPTA